MTDRERKIHVLEMVANLAIVTYALLPEELADLRSLLEDLKGEPVNKFYTEREFEIAYCVGLLNRALTMDELSEELKRAKEKIMRLKEAVERGDFEPLQPSKN